MGDRTNIPWCDATWNPVSGCTKVSPGCAHCYAEAVTLRFKRGGPFLPGKTTIKLHPDRLDQPLHWRRPRRIFGCSMGDLFHEEVPFEFIGRVFITMALAPHHTYQWLTKRPERMLEWFAWAERHKSDHGDGSPVLPRMSMTRGPWPLPNVWLGVSVENQVFADRRIPLLLQTPAAVRFLSLEPLLKPVDLSQWLRPERMEYDPNGGPVGYVPDEVLVDWVIVGGESGPRHRPMDIAGVSDIRDKCVATGVPVFVKQASHRLPGQQGDIPDDLWALKEFPTPGRPA